MTATLYLTALALHCITIPSLSSPPTHSPDSPPAPGLIVTTCLYTSTSASFAAAELGTYR